MAGKYLVIDKAPYSTVIRDFETIPDLLNAVLAGEFGPRGELIIARRMELRVVDAEEAAMTSLHTEFMPLHLIDGSSLPAGPPRIFSDERGQVHVETTGTDSVAAIQEPTEPTATLGNPSGITEEPF